MPFARLAFLVLSIGCVLPTARAHSAGESSLVLTRDAENLLVACSLSVSSAAALLSPDAISALSAGTFEQHRNALQAAATRVCTLTDASGTSLTAERVLVSFHDAHEVRFDFLFSASARPARISLPFLSSLSTDAYCVVSDSRSGPPRRAVLSRRSSELEIPLALE